jgi:hypothetical protein
MIKHELLEDDAILIVSPSEALESQDFDDLARAVDPYIEEHGPLAGLVIETQRFPGWDSFGSLISHLRFVREHHQNIKKVAAATDSGFLSILPLVANHFVAAEVRHFNFADKSEAMQWIRE